MAAEAEERWTKELSKQGVAVEAVAFGPTALCSTNCGPDPIFDAMDPLFNLDDFPEEIEEESA